MASNQEITSARRSRGQYQYHAEVQLDEFKVLIGALRGNPDEDEYERAKTQYDLTREAIEKYEKAVLKCQTLEDMTDEQVEQDRFNDNLHKVQLDITKFYRELAVVRSSLDRQQAATGAAAHHGNANAAPTANRTPAKFSTALKPDKLEAEASLAQYKAWREAFESYYEANAMAALTQKEQRAHLRSCLSDEMALTVIGVLGVLQTEAVTEVLDKLGNHFGRSRSKLARRYDFRTCRQKPGESNAQFFTRAKLLADDAELGRIPYDDELATQIVTGIRNSALQGELLRLAPEDQTLENIKQLSLRWEEAERSQQILSGSSASLRAVRHNQRGRSANRKGQYQGSRQRSTSADRKSCQGCG